MTMAIAKGYNGKIILSDVVQWHWENLTEQILDSFSIAELLEAIKRKLKARNVR